MISEGLGDEEGGIALYCFGSLRGWEDDFTETGNGLFPRYTVFHFLHYKAAKVWREGWRGLSFHLASTISGDGREGGFCGMGRGFGQPIWYRSGFHTDKSVPRSGSDIRY
jgi:hypothetical protein